MRIQEHTELEVYKKAFDAAMSIFLATKKFSKDEMYSLLTRFVARLARFVQIWRRLGESDVTRLLLSPNFQTRKPKPLKPRFGFSLRCRADIWITIPATLSIEAMMKFFAC
jgi:hypothetical protein